MSSHHIVRDAQEPALLLAAEEALGLEVIQHLLEWSPTVVCLAEVLPTALLQGYKIDAVAGALEASWQAKLLAQMPVQLIAAEQSPAQAMTGALDWLAEQGHHQVSIVGFFMPELRLQTSLNLIFYVQEYKYFWIQHTHWHKWVRQGTRFELITSAQAQLQTTNLLPDYTEWIAQADGFVGFDVSEAGFWVKERLGLSA
jgi:thiamine pyrophosphokinase